MADNNENSSNKYLKIIWNLITSIIEIIFFGAILFLIIKNLVSGNFISIFSHTIPFAIASLFYLKAILSYKRYQELPLTNNKNQFITYFFIGLAFTLTGLFLSDLTTIYLTSLLK
jgi:hypothetical protein